MYKELGIILSRVAMHKGVLAAIFHSRLLRKHKTEIIKMEYKGITIL